VEKSEQKGKKEKNPRAPLPFSRLRQNNQKKKKKRKKKK